MSSAVTASLTRHLVGVTRRRRALGAPQVLVRSPLLPGDFRFGDQVTPFHAASIGKMPTAVLVMQLVEEGALTLDTRIAAILPPEVLADLFVVHDVDHAGDVTVRQLLDHTSGIADYFEGIVTSGSGFLDLVLSDRDHLWLPHELLDFSRTRQRAVGSPGEMFHYSDTGYVLAGLVVEAMTAVPFHESLHDRIFTPLHMDDSYLMYRSVPTGAAPTGAAPAIAPLWLDGVEASTFRSISCDWAGGGIVSTLDDLLRFSVGLHDGTLLSASSLAELTTIRHRFRSGIHYGSGMMEIRFEEFFFLLRGLARPIGHIGVLGTHLFRDATHDAHIVMNFHSTAEMTRSFRTLIEIERGLTRLAR